MWVKQQTMWKYLLSFEWLAWGKNILGFQNWKEVLSWVEKRYPGRGKTISFHVWTLGIASVHTLPLDTGHDPAAGQSCLHITLIQCHCELVDRIFCNCSQVSQYMNLLSSESVRNRIFITYFFSISSLFFSCKCLIKYSMLGT